MNTGVVGAGRPRSAAQTARAVVGLFKLRIGVMIMASALVGLAVTPGPELAPLPVVVLALAVLLASASAGALNQYVEHDSDRLMARTRTRAFVTGELPHHPAWLALIAAMLIVAVAAAWWAANGWAALYVFLGAFTYGVVYTVWLKRRSWTNIVIGGLAGSFAVLAGGAAVDPGLSPLPLLLALVLFLWTPPHFWSLAIAGHDDYAAAGVPMLPVVAGVPRAARVVYASTVALAMASLLPVLYGAGWAYLLGAGSGSAYFVYRARGLAVSPCRRTAMAAFFASLLQLTLLFAGAVLDGVLR